LNDRGINVLRKNESGNILGKVRQRSVDRPEKESTGACFYGIVVGGVR